MATLTKHYDKTELAPEQLQQLDLGRMDPSQLVDTMRRAGLKNRLNGRSFDPDSALTNGWEGYKPVQILAGLRQQMIKHTSMMSDGLRLRLRYLYQLQMVPPTLRKRMGKYVGLSFLPGTGKLYFPKHGFWDIDRIRCVTINTRTDRRDVSNNNSRDYFDLRVHLMQVDHTTGLSRIGGTEVIDNQPYYLTKMSRIFSLEPKHLPYLVPPTEDALIATGVAIHEDLEMAAADDYIGQTRPIFPEIWVGFSPDDSIPLHITNGLRRDTLNSILEWLYHGCRREDCTVNGSYWSEQICKKLQNCDYDNLISWSDVEQILGEEDSKSMLGWSQARMMTEYDGLMFLPSAFFEPSIFKSTKRVCVKMDRLMGREVPCQDGYRDIEPSWAGVQVIRIPEEDVLSGEVGSLLYSFGEQEQDCQADLS